MYNVTIWEEQGYSNVINQMDPVTKARCIEKEMQQFVLLTLSSLRPWFTTASLLSAKVSTNPAN